MALIVEFNGLPGSGKTTVTENVIQFLNEEDILNGVYNDMTYGEKISKAKKLIYLIFQSNLIELWQLFCIARSTDNALNRLMLKRIFIAERICCAYRKAQKSNKVYIVDQGIVQAIISIIHTGNIIKHLQFEKNLKNLLNRYDCLYINTILDVGEVVNRIHYRNFKNGSRFNRISDVNQLTEMLYKQNELILYIRKIIQSLDVDAFNMDMGQPADKNGIVLKNAIKKRIAT